MLMLPVILWTTRLTVLVFLRKNEVRVGDCWYKGGGYDKLSAFWDPYVKDYEDRSFLFLSLESLLNLLLSQFTVFLSICSCHCYKGLLCITHRLLAFVRLVLYWESQGRTKTGYPTSTRHCYSQQLLNQTEPRWSYGKPRWVRRPCDREAVQSQPVINHGKMIFTGLHYNPLIKFHLERIGQWKTQLWQVPCSESATSALLPVSQEEHKEVVRICMVIEFYFIFCSSLYKAAWKRRLAILLLMTFFDPWDFCGSTIFSSVLCLIRKNKRHLRQGSRSSKFQQLMWTVSLQLLMLTLLLAEQIFS